MNEHRTANRFNWWLPFYGALGACVVLFPKTVFGNDIGVFLITIALAGLVSLVLLIVAVRMIRRSESTDRSNGRDFLRCFLGFCLEPPTIYVQEDDG